jgi:hypothetical protein
VTGDEPGERFILPVPALSARHDAIIFPEGVGTLINEKEPTMKHQTLDQLQTIAEVKPSARYPTMTRRQRIERWAELLEQNPQRCLGALTGTEYLTPEARAVARGAGSPITVAFEDPVLRTQGLKDDTYGEAKRFFEVSDWQLHDIVCHCHVGATMQARWAAARVRRTIDGNRFLGWLRAALAH